MKKVRRISRWILLSLFVQILFLSYLDFIYLPQQSHVSVSAFEEWDPESERKFKIAMEAVAVKVSFNGAYAGYTVKDQLFLMDTKNSKMLKTIDCGEISDNYFRWLPDRNMVIYSLYTKGSDKIEIATYDMDSGVERRYPAITGVAKDSGVMDIELSTLTNVVYVRIKSGEAKTMVYKYDIMDKLDWVMNLSPDRNLAELRYSDKVIYENEKNMLSVKDNQGSSMLSSLGKAVLLGVGSDDTVYAGAVNSEGLISKIFYGPLEELKAKQWTELDVDGDMRIEDIVIHSKLGVYMLVQDRHLLQGIGMDRQIRLPGDFIELHDRFVVTRTGDWVQINTI